MKEAILEILNSKELQEKMKTEGLKHAQNFTDHKIADNLMKVYTSL
jgi:glycosyltransferase involved in cell wall biosynthesis